MRDVSCFYAGKAAFERHLKDNGVDCASECLVTINAVGTMPDASVEIAKDIRSVLPRAKIRGLSSCLLRGEYTTTESGVLVTVSIMDKVQCDIALLDATGFDPDKMAKTVADLINGKDKPQLASVFFSSNAALLDKFVEKYNSYAGSVPLVGGIVTSSGKVTGFVFNEHGYTEDGIFLNVWYGADFHVNSIVVNNIAPISEVFEITKVDGQNILEISGKPVGEFVKENLGFDYSLATDINAVLTQFPLVLEDNNHVTRFLCYKNETGQFNILDGVSIKSGDKFRIGYQSRASFLDDCADLADKLDNIPCEKLVCLSCIARTQMFKKMHNAIIESLNPCNPLVMYMGGEIGCSNGTNIVCQGTIVYLTVSESKDSRSGAVDRSKYAEAVKSDAATEQLYINILQKRSSQLLSSKEHLLRQLLEKERSMTSEMFLDPDTGLYNSEKFKADSKERQFDKLCLVQIEKSAQLSNYLGKEEYLKYFVQNARLFEDKLTKDLFLNADADKTSIFLYQLDYSNIILAAPASVSDERFKDEMSNLFVEFGKHYAYNDMVCINDFFLVIGYDSELLDKAQLMASESASSSKRFSIYEERKVEDSNFEESMQILSAINYAIENDGVEPYFQPIFDNEANCTKKFESLMRIRGADGKMWMPNQFLPIAKEYHLYLQLSSVMINKVIELFSDRTEAVSINLSALDINSDAVTSMVFQLLQRIKNPQNIIFEIIESDAFEDMNRLSMFIERLRRYNVLIAIDDFGSGYSNLLEIVKLRPDIIKIDGEIIRHLLNDEVNRNIIDVIVFMAARFGVDLVAEYAESEQIQKFLAEKGIRYSQGYFFSKPMPFDRIDAYLAEERQKHGNANS